MQKQPPVNSVKVFISYSHADIKLAHELDASLTSCGVEVWLDENEIKVGDSILMRISQALQDTHYVMLLMSKASLESRWVEREWLPVLMMEIEARDIILLPVRLDDCQIPIMLRDKLYADMRKGYWRGLSEIVDVFAARLVALYSDRTGIKAPQVSFKTISSLNSILDAVKADENIEVASLLNTIILSSFSGKDAIEPPDWLLGDWLSVKGWNEGQIFKCTHASLSDPRVFNKPAIGSFSSSLWEGMVHSVVNLDTRTLLFSWYQLVGGLMSSEVLVDSGWGIWKTDMSHTRLKGIWWYGIAGRSSELVIYRGVPSLRAYIWELKKVSTGTATPSS
jgi:hypothetical protein